MAKRKDWADMKNIPMTETRYQKQGGRWIKTAQQKKIVSENEHRLATNDETLRWFRNTGGYEKNEYGYTKRGYLPYENVSISPDRQTKVVRKYDLNNSKIRDAQYERRYRIKKR